MPTSFISTLRSSFTPDMRAFAMLCIAYALFGLARIAFGYVPGFLIFLAPVFLIVPLVRPKAGLWAIITLTILFERFFTLEPFQFGRYALKLYPIDLVLLGVFGGVIASIVFRRTVAYFDRSIGMLGIFFGIASLYLAASFLGFGDRDLAVAVSTWKNYVFYGLLACVLPQLLISEQDIRQTVRVFLVSVAVALVFLLIGILRGGGLWTEFTPLSTGGVRLLAFPHAFYFSIALIALLVSNDYWDPYKRSGFVWMLLGWLAFGILSSLMRHIWIGMFLSIAFAFVFFMRHEARQKMAALSFVALGIGTALFSVALVFATLFPTLGPSQSIQAIQGVVAERLVSIGSSSDTSISWRGTTWKSAIDEIEKHPITGAGFGRHVAVESGDYHDFVEVRNIHNSWLAVFVQMGFIGGLAFIGVFGIIALSLIRLPAYGTWQYAFRATLLALLAYEALLMLAQPYLETNLLNVIIWMTLGFSIALCRVARTNPTMAASSAR